MVWQPVRARTSAATQPDRMVCFIRTGTECVPPRANLTSGLRLKPDFAQFDLERLLECLQVRRRRFVALLLRSDAEPAHLVEIPDRALTVAEGNVAADQRAGPRDGVDGEGDFAGSGGG